MTSWFSRPLRLRAVAAIVGAAGVVKYLFFTEGAMLGRPPLDWDTVSIRVPLVIWWTGPLVLYVLATRSKIGSFVGLILPILTVVFLHVIYQDESSTAGIPLLLAPTVVYIATGALVAVDNLVLVLRNRIAKAAR